MTKPLLEIAKAVVQTEADSILMLKDRIDQTFNDVCQLILSCQGKVILIGMGKSGHIAKKIAATLASTGTPSFYVHPGEAGHGDDRAPGDSSRGCASAGGGGGGGERCRGAGGRSGGSERCRGAA